jgi:hypothetical protein
MRVLANILTAVTVLSFAVPQTAVATRGSKLTYAQARRAIQSKADSFAGTSTRITTMYRLGAAAYSGSAEWDRTNPTGCNGCGYDPVTGDIYDTPSTESCSASIRAKRLSSGRIRVGIENFFCI